MRKFLVLTMAVALAVVVPISGPAAQETPEGRRPPDTGKMLRELQKFEDKSDKKGLKKHVLEDGTVMYTHGEDPPHSHTPVARSGQLALSSSHYECADPGEPAIQLLHYWPAEKANTVLADHVQQMFYTMAEDLGWEVRNRPPGGQTFKYRVRCNAQGSPHVYYNWLPFPSTDPQYCCGDRFNRIVSALRSHGHVDSDTKYLVLIDDRNAGGWGQGTFWNDSRLAGDNANNGEYGGGAAYAFSYGAYDVIGANHFRHELGHSMGAVNTDSPWSDQGAHCKLEWDVMCGGAQATIQWCPLPPPPYSHEGVFDCSQNDYFYAGFPPSQRYSYLQTHWNLGFCWNRFISLYPYCQTDYNAYQWWYQR
jgi:hypothetical protein